MDPRFGNLIWTHHALKRLKERRLSQTDAWATWRRPDNSRYAAKKGAWVYYRTFGGQKIEVVAKKNEKGEWVVLSVWARPVKRAKESPPSLWQKLMDRLFKNHHS